ncbi:MAG TPA: condensation domain-containing protein, partial [Thermoanaerobaculia bacterium]|nr:condensation domain-containing protein [Thermoanaerobaculia bacterium]
MSPDAPRRPTRPPSRITARPAGGPVACSFAQERLWFLDRLVPGSSSYNTDVAVRFPAPCDLEALRLALNGIVARHEALRTTFMEVDGRPYQVIAEGLVLDLPLIELAGSDAAPAMAEARRIAAAHTAAAFDLASGPMLRPLALRFAGGEVVLVVAMHHIVTDGWSMRVFLDELRRLYDAARSSLPSPLAPLPIQYADYAVWQRQRLGETRLATELSWWAETLAELPTIELPCDHPRPARGSFRGASHHLSLPPGVADALRGLARSERATMFMALLAGFVGLLARYGAGDDIVVGTPVAGRPRTELEGLIGFFVNTLVLRCDAGDDPTFRQLLARVRSVTLDAFAHQELPFEKLVEELQPQRDLSRNPLFQVMFHHIGHADPVPAAPSRSRSVISDRDTAAFDLSVNVWESPSGLRARFEYATDLFEAPTIARMATHYRRLLTAAAAQPDLPLSALGMLEEAETEELLQAARGPSVEVPPLCVHELVDATAAAC